MDDEVFPDEPLVTRTEAEGETVDLPAGVCFFTTGQVLGERYEILELLGRGGMGEVWRAFDLKLRVEVALKALREDLFQSEGRREMLRQEVRAAREVVSPNVCRIFDLHELDGRELVSMEYVDGATLLGVLQERGPLELKEAQDIASQFLSGLEAIHTAGLVHRDVKPENIMLTRAGRVVVMDFGLARGPESGAGSVSGTPAYMAPEHAAGQEVDARADVYSAGVVLAEMVCPEGIKSYQSRQSVWEGVRSEPAQVPDSPWAPVIARAVARDRERRQNSAHTLIRELEDVTLRVEGAEDLHPYPGLASFTEEDAEFFFGREAEIEAMWAKLDGPARLLGLVGPSGAGKTSFLRAGVIPHAEPGWAIVRCTPGNSAMASLRQALVPALAGDTEALGALAGGGDDATLSAWARWRTLHHRTLLIVDQFEELFTLNPPDVQSRLADLLRRFPLETDVHVVVSMRDDFLMECNRFEELRPAVADLTLLDRPTGANLRRTLVQPAAKCGYRFEDDELVEEILAEVEGERGALPLLAFALARLWEKRDREAGLLTRQAYHDIGGVGGALARHAEATVDRIGVERIPIVRELFRNLVTAEGTRAVREWDELLSVFEGEEVRKLESEKVKRSVLPSVASKTLGVRRPTPHSERSERSPSHSEHSERSRLTSHSEQSERSPDRGGEAAAVLRELIDARLLTSYEVREDEHEPTRRVEIIHESLLANWPRLVRWQTQDADAVQVREQLRQAAKTWYEHDRTDDMLWAGAAYREFASWRERYPGGLTELEEAFASAMTSLATRRRRRRRIALGAIMTALLIGLSVVGAFWQRSVREARRAESANLLSRAQLQLESYPSAALAYATASLGLSDSIEARRLAVEALWRGPTAFVLRDGRSWEIEFTPDGEWLVQAMDEPPYQLTVFGADGSVTPLQDVHDDWVDLVMDATAGHFATLDWGNDEPSCVWSAPEQRLLAQGSPSGPVIRWGAVVDSTSRRLVVVIRDGEEIHVETLGFDGEYRRLGTLPFTTRRDDDGRFSTIAVLEPASGKRLFVLRDHAVYVVEVGDTILGSPKRLDRIEATVVNHGITVDPRGRFIVTRHQDASIRIWDLQGEASPKTIPEPSGISSLSLARDGSLLEAVDRQDNAVTSWVWSLEEPQPRLLRRNDLGKSGGIAGWTLDPVGRRIVSILNPDAKIRLWYLSMPEDAAPVVMQRGEGGGGARRVKVHPNGQWLATSFTHGLTLWPLSRRYPVVIDRYEDWKVWTEFGPQGEWLATSSVDSAGTVRLWQLEGDNLPAGRVLGEVGPYAYGLAWSPDGGSLIVGSHSKGANMLFLDGQPPRRLPGDEGHMGSVAISPDGKLAAGASLDTGGIRFWNLETLETIVGTELRSGMGTGIAVRFAADDRLLVGSELGLESLDLGTGQRETLYEGRVGTDLDVSADGSLVIFGSSGIDSPSGTMSQLSRPVVLDVQTREATSLDTHGDRITTVALDPAGNFAVTGDVDGAIRVDPLDGSDPHLLLGSPGEIFDVNVDPKGRWIASTSGTELRLWPMPDLSKPPLHALPREELIAKLKTLTNLRVVRDPDSATGWTLTHDPFPGWEKVPTW